MAGQHWVQQLPLGVSDPLFTHYLALELHMSVRQLGESMSAHELTVEWPVYFATRQRMREAEEEREKQKGRRV